MKKTNFFTFPQKIIFIELVSLLLPLTLTLTLCYSAYSSMVINDVKSVSMQQANFLSQYLNSIFSSVDHNLTTWMNNNHIRNYFEIDDYQREEPASIKSALIHLCTFEEYYQNAYLYHAGQEKVYSAFSESNEDSVDYKSAEFQDWVSSVSKIYSFHIGLYPFGRDSSIFCIIPIRSHGSRRFLGYCMLKLSTLIIADAFTTCDYPYGNLYCINNTGEVLYSTDQSSGLPVDFSLLPNSGSIKKINHQLVYKDAVLQTDISIISICPDSVRSLQGTISFYTVIVISVIFILFCLCISIFLLRKFLHPIHSLAKTMETVDPNDLKTIPVSNSHDEISILEETYNGMITKINDLVITQYQADIAVRDARLHALQLQINPHFVNNTLQMIGTLAAERDMMDIYDLICAFSRTFYYCLKYKGDIVLLEDELDYLKDYIMIQEHRFPDKFRFETEIDERTVRLEIPKMVIQPLVENAFTHSFGNMHEKWFIRIRSVYYGSYYTIVVEDNGCGMTEKTLQELYRQLDENNAVSSYQTRTHIGIQNVDMRIKLLYGMKYGLKIESELSKGTKITLILSTKEGENR